MSEAGAAREPDDTAVLTSRVRVPDHVVYRAFVNETVVLNLHTGRYHGVNRTGARMLEVLERSDTIAQAAGQLAEEYEQPVADLERDLTAFCADLSERGLIELVEPSPES